ncbi:F-box protein CPR1-like [Bidens hawaiensis]|uniref:F-box protein CPR1-like n=1 Tax=Bidens hawaiensis TaxID=980011 RepID=UPI00404A8924
MAAELALDVVEQMLLRLDVEDLIRCKSVCKSWLSFISSPGFVQAHLKRNVKSDSDNLELGHRRMASHLIRSEDFWFFRNFFHIVGSSNGLVCVSPQDVDFLLINPSTREQKQLPTPPYRPRMHKIGMIRQVACWGFGYDSSIDDYKVIAGFSKNLHIKRTCFHVLTLKSNVWKKKKKKVIISLDLSTEELKEIPEPLPDMLYVRDIDHCLGVIDECLCIYSVYPPFSSNTWVLKSNKWELYNSNDHCEINKYDIVHGLTLVVESPPSFIYSHMDGPDGRREPSSGDYMRASIFVKSLVSPHSHVNEGQTRNAKQGQEGGNESTAERGNIRKRKRKSKSKSKSQRSIVVL